MVLLLLPKQKQVKKYFILCAIPLPNIAGTGGLCLKIRKFCLLGSVLLFGGILVIGFLQQIAVYKLLLLLFLIGGSPLYLIPFFRLAKPETLSWTLFLPTLYSFVTGHYVICAIGGLGIAILNFTVTLLLIETVFLVSISTSNLGWGMLVSALPILKLLLDLTPFFKKSYIKVIFSFLASILLLYPFF